MWYVHVWVCGTYSGCYEYETEALAERDASGRRENLSILGCRYTVSDKPDLR